MATVFTLEPNKIRIDLSYFSDPHIEWVVENGVGVFQVQERRDEQDISALQTMDVSNLFAHPVQNADLEPQCKEYVIRALFSEAWR